MIMATRPMEEGRLPPESTAPQDVIGNGIHNQRGRLALDTVTPVNQAGCFESDRVIKSGYVQKRTQKTKVCHSTSCSPD